MLLAYLVNLSQVTKAAVLCYNTTKVGTKYVGMTYGDVWPYWFVNVRIFIESL